VDLLLADPTPEADSPLDPVWAGTLVAGRARGGVILVTPDELDCACRAAGLCSQASTDRGVVELNLPDSGPAVPAQPEQQSRPPRLQ